MSDKNKNKSCNDHLWSQANKWISLILIILVLVIVLIQAAYNPDAIQRYNIRATGEQKTGGGEAGAEMWGPLTLDSNNNRITFEFRTLNMAAASAIHLKGPMVSGTKEGCIVAVLCGSPSPLPACNVSMPGEIPLTIVKEVWDGVTVVAQDMRILLRDVRANPHLYYLEGQNANGGVRSELNGITGTP